MTLIELLIVIVIIAILISVFCLAFFVTNRASKPRSHCDGDRVTTKAVDVITTNTLADSNWLPPMSDDHSGLRFGPHGPWGPYF